jgi:branched-chain amino acid transport system substrate-binding protein
MNGVLNVYPPEISDYVRMGRDSARVVRDAFKKKFDTEPGELSAISYDAVFVLKAAIEKAGSIQNEAVNAALFKLRLDELPKLVNIYEAHPDGRLFNSQGQVLFPGTPHIWSDGKWLPYDLNQK